MKKGNPADVPAATALGTAPERLDVERVRRDFPALHQLVHGKPLVYLDNAATTQKPRRVIDAIARYYSQDNSNVHRGVHFLSQKATKDYEDARLAVKNLLHAARTEEIVFVRGATEGVNLVVASFCRSRLEPGDEIVVTGMEHHSNIVPWQMLCEASGAKLRVAPFNERGEILLEEYRNLLGPRTRFVAAVHVSNALGTVNPVKELTRLAHEKDIPILIDGAQAVAHTAVDVREIGCDFYVFSGHKMFGPTGIGALYGRHELLESMPPYQGGGDMILSVTFEKTMYQKPPYRFEAGTPHIAGGVGLRAAIDYVRETGLDRIADYEKRLLAYGTEQVGAIGGVRIIGTAREKASVLSFVVEDIHPHDVGTILDQEGIAVRAGHHCAQPVMERLGVPATVRASFSFYNTFEEVDRLAAALIKVKEIFG